MFEKSNVTEAIEWRLRLVVRLVHVTKTKKKRRTPCSEQHKQRRWSEISAIIAGGIVDVKQYNLPSASVGCNGVGVCWVDMMYLSLFVMWRWTMKLSCAQTERWCNGINLQPLLFKRPKSRNPASSNQRFRAAGSCATTANARSANAISCLSNLVSQDKCGTGSSAGGGSGRGKPLSHRARYSRSIYLSYIRCY